MAQDHGHLRQRLVASPSAGPPVDLYAPLPVPETLDPAAARVAFDFARQRLRPAVLSSLEDQYRRSTRRPEDFVDVVELELRLQQVERWCEAVEAAFQLSRSVVPAQRRHVDLRDVETHGHQVASGTARLFCCPLSPWFVHGPILLRYAIGLAERLLVPEERIVAVAEASWRRIVVNHLRLTAHDLAVGIVGEPDRELAFTGLLATSQGRVLRVAGAQIPGDPVVALSGVNTLTFGLLREGCSYDRVKRVWRFGLSPDRGEEQGPALDAHAGVTAMTLVEVLSVGMVNLRSGSGGQVLLAGVRNLPVAGPYGEIFRTGGTLELRDLPDRIRQTRAGLALVPVEYRFLPFQRDFEPALLAETKLPYFRLLGE